MTNGNYSKRPDLNAQSNQSKSLPNSESQYRLLFENMLDGYAYCETQFDDHDRLMDFVYLSVNGAFERLTGLKNVEGKWVSELIPGIREQNPEVFEIYGRVVQTGIPEVFDLDLKLLGKWFTISVFSPEKGRFIAVFCDITERKKAELELRIAATAFETQEGMVVTDANCVILRVNNAFSKITGYMAEEAIGQTPRMLKSGRHDMPFYAAMWKSIQNTGAWQGEIWNRRKNGEIYPEHLTITAVKGGNKGDITHYVATMSDISERKRTEEQIYNLAFHDSLTGLPNRRLLSDRLEQSMASSKRSGRYGALMFLDLDNFKPLNDMHGHEVGDLLLQEAGCRISNCVREMDTVARFGGDEFIVVLSELDEDKSESAAQASIIAEKIRATLDVPYMLKLKHEGKSETTIDHCCSTSVGIKLFLNHEASAEDIIKWADMAMYQAKEAGGDLIRFYDPNY